MLQVAADAQMRAALAADLTVRCLLKTKYHCDSRNSKVAIAWAQSRAEKLSTVLLQHIGPQTAGFSIQLNMVELLGHRDRAYILYDLFLQECSQDVRTQVNQSFDRPVYVVARRGQVHHAHRGNKAVEDMVAGEYEHAAQSDKGSRPYFYDGLNRPVYVDGERVENLEDHFDPMTVEYLRARQRGNVSLPEADDDDMLDEDDVPDEDTAEDEAATQATTLDGTAVGAGRADGTETAREEQAKDA